MRINRYVALCSDLSRRAADQAIKDGRVLINSELATLAADVSENDKVYLNGTILHLPAKTQTIVLNKPKGYVVSRDGQGSKTIYELLPPALHMLKPVGRLDKYSSGLLLLTNDGELAYQLTHPSFQKTKIYEIVLNTGLQPLHKQMISEMGINLEDGPSRLILERIQEGSDLAWRVIMHEGRNRQIRRTFDALGYKVIRLHRTNFGNYALVSNTKPGDYYTVTT